MAGLKIHIDTAAAERAAGQLRKELEVLGSSAIDNEKDFKKLEDRLKDGMKADKAEKSLDHLKKTINLTRLETAKLQAGIGDYSGALKTMVSGQDGAVKSATGLKNAVAGLLATVGAGAAVKKTLTAFSDIDSGLIAVQKTTNMTDEEMQILRGTLEDMSTNTVPIATKKLLEIAAAAGQLGVKGVEDISLFTKVLGQLELASDIIGEDGAKAIARLLNVTGEAMDEVDTLGSVIVALGNNTAATEAEILSLATEVGQATSVFAVTSGEAAGLAAAMKSIGVRAELGGSVVGRAMRSIESSINAGGESMQLLMATTQMTDEQLKQTFATNSTLVFQKWVEGVGRVIRSGESAEDVLKEFGLSGEEVLKVLPAMATKSHLLADALNIAAKETNHATALTEEAIRASKSFASQMTLTMNAVDQIAAEIGSGLAPEIVRVAQDFREWVSANDELLKQDIPETMADIAKAAKGVGEIAVDVAKLGVNIGTMFEDVVTGWNSMPTIVQEIGIVGAVVGGAKARVALVMIAEAIGLSKNLIEQQGKAAVTAEKLNSKERAQANILGALTKGWGSSTGAAKKYAEVVDKAMSDTYDLDFGTWADGLDTIQKAIEDTYDLDFGTWTDGIQDVGEQTARTAIEIDKELKKIDSSLQSFFRELDSEENKIKDDYFNVEKNMASIEEMTEAELLALEIRTDAERERYEAGIKAAEEHKEAVQEAQADMLDTIQEYTSEIISDWDNAGDMLVDIAKRTAAEMAAAFISQEFIIPIATQIGSNLGMSWNGVPMSAMAGGGGAGFGGFNLPSGQTLSWLGNNIPGMGALGSAMSWTLPGTATVGAELGWGAAAAQDIGAMASSGVSLGTALGYGGMGGLGYQYIGGALGLPQSKYSGLTAGIGGALGGTYAGSILGAAGFSGVAGAAGGAAAGASAGSVVPVVGTVIGAIIGGLAGSLLGDEEKPDIRIGSLPGQGLSPSTHDVSGSGTREQFNSLTQQYFESQFDALDQMVDWSVEQAIQGAGFRARVRLDKYEEGETGRMLTDLIDFAFTGEQGRGAQSGSLRESFLGEMGLSTDLFDVDFFEGLRGEGESLLNAFARFADVADEFDNFESRISDQLGAGSSLEQAYSNLTSIATILDAVAVAGSQLSTSSIIETVRGFVTSQEQYLNSLKEAGATQQELAIVQEGIAQQIGATVTGLTANTLQEVMLTGGDVGGSLQTSIKSSVASMMAGMFSENIMEDFGSELNDAVGDLFSDIDIDSLAPEELSGLFNSVLGDFDWEGMDAAVSAATNVISGFVGAAEETVDVIEDVSESLAQIGESLTGLNQNTLQSMITGWESGTSSIQETVKASMGQVIAGAFSENIMSEYGAGLNETLGAIFDEIDFESITPEELNSAFSSVLEDFDWAGMESAVSAAADSINDFTGATQRAAAASAAAAAEEATAEAKANARAAEIRAQNSTNFTSNLEDEYANLTLSSYENSLRNVDKWYEQQLEDSKDLDVNTEFLKEVYELKKQTIVNAETERIESERQAEIERERTIAAREAESYAREQARAMEEAAREAAKIRETFQDIVDDLYDTRTSLSMSAGGMSPDQQLALTQELFDRNYQAAMTGEVEALEGLSDFAKDYVDAAKLSVGSAREYSDFIAEIQQKLFLAEGVAMGKVNGYADGGIADGPLSGHWELLHGREAVIPLNGQAIPLQLDYSVFYRILDAVQSFIRVSEDSQKRLEDLTDIIERVTQGGDTIRITEAA